MPLFSPLDGASRLGKGVVAMKESVTYQAILSEGLAEGRIEEARRLTVLLGRSRLGDPPAEVISALDAVTDVEKLEALCLRSQQAADWQELLGSNG
jgi:hypothetical protein